MVSFKGFGVVTLFALAATGCGSSYTATLTSITQMPDDSVFSASSAHLHTGIATSFAPAVTMQNAWGDHSQLDGITVTTTDPGVIQVAPVLEDGRHTSTTDSEGDPAAGRWVVWAVGPGTASLVVGDSGNVALTVPVLVTDPD